MRVGIATAQSLAWALEVPVIPVCSLDALAQTVSWSDTPIVAALDARRGEVYWALYRTRGQELQRIVEPTVTSPEDLAIHIADRAEEVVCVGTGFKRYSDTFETNPWGRMIEGDSLFPTASAVVSLGAIALLNDNTVTPDNVEPMYLRVPDAEINWKTREATP
jgi:tRNA threonylcarbamoyladenosine biosynthesis protein TsaB